MENTTLQALGNRIVSVYDTYLKAKDEEEERIQTTYYASGAGLCIKKHLFGVLDSVEKEPPDTTSLRLFRLGDLLHLDLQQALEESEWCQVENYTVEHEVRIEIPEYNVSGRIDTLLTRETERDTEAIIIDWKTANEWSFKKMAKDPMQYERYMLQVATYAMGIAHEYDSIGMLILAYNKNRSQVEVIPVPEEMIDKADAYWNAVLSNIALLGEQYTFNEVNDMVPGGTDGAPVHKWECKKKYCPVWEYCDSPYIE